MIAEHLSLVEVALYGLRAESALVVGSVFKTLLLLDGVLKFVAEESLDFLFVLESGRSDLYHTPRLRCGVLPAGIHHYREFREGRIGLQESVCVNEV